MRKNSIYFLVLLIVLSLGLTLVQQVLSQPENIKVQNYSWYVDSEGYFNFVGEVQNTGPNTIESVILEGIITTVDGNQTYSNPTYVYVNCLVPQQKAPFYIELPSPQTDDLSWLSMAVDHIDFTVLSANVTSDYLYPYVTVKSSSGGVDEEGIYWVSGSVQNIGSQTASTIRVIGTFYNASGIVVAAGHTDHLTPVSLSPSSVAPFKVSAFNLNETLVSSAQKISSYSLLVQVKDPLQSGTPPSLPPTDPTPTSSSSDGTPSSSDTTTQSAPIAPETQIIAVVVVVILVVVGTILVLNKRKAIAQAPKKRKSQTRKNKK